MTLQWVVSTTPPDEVPTWPFDGRGFVADGWRPKLKLVRHTINGESILTVKPSYTWCVLAATLVPLMLACVVYFVGPKLPLKSGARGDLFWLLGAVGFAVSLSSIFFFIVAQPFFSLRLLVPLLTYNLHTKRLTWHCGEHDVSLDNIAHIDRFYGTVHWHGSLDWHDYVQIRVQTRDGKTHVVWHCEVRFDEDKAAIREFAELAGIPLREHLVDVDQRHPSSREQPRFFVPKYGKFNKS